MMRTQIYDLFNKDEQIKLLVENSEDIISIHDMEANYLFYGGSTKYKCTVNEIVGKSPYDFFEKDIANKIVKQIKKTAQTGEKFKSEVETKRFGNKKWFQIIISPLIKNGEIISVIKICRDITERIKIKQEIIQQKEFLNSIINAISNPLYVIDAKSYKVVLANKATLLGQNLKMNTCFGLTHNSDIPCWENGHDCPVNKVKETLQPCVIEHIHIDKDNEKRIYEVHGFPVFDENNNVIQVIEYNIDITEKKKLEEALIIEKEKANESNKLKSAFLANMSHEIRTPMNSIIGFGELLKNENISIEKKNQFVNFINQSGNHLLEIIDDIIEISKIDAKQLKAKMSEFRLIPFMKEIYDSFNFQIKDNTNKKLSINCFMESDKDYIISDRKWLRQILTNLISNALKFTHFGTVDISYYLLNDEQLLFKVKDTGIGISKEDLPFVFERFRQVGDETQTVFGGTGLGLAISKGFVELMGGSISVESEKETGSIFMFTIPYKSFK